MRRRGWVALGWACLALAAGLLGSLAQATPLRDSLDTNTRSWLQSHAEWRVGVVRDWPPIDGVNPQGQHLGASAEILSAAAARLGVHVTPVVFDNFRDALLAAQEGRVELLSSVSRTPARERDLLFTESYLQIPAVYIARRGTRDFAESPDFGGRRLVVERGYPVQELMATRFPAVKVVVVGSTAEALRAVANGEADIWRGALTPAHYIIERELLANLEVLNTARLPTADLRFATSIPAVRSTLDAALRAIGPDALRRMADRWQPSYLALTPPRGPLVPSAAAVQALGEVRVAYDAAFSPISRTEPNGEAGGLAAEMFRRSADTAGLRYRFLPYASFEGAVQALREQRADVVLAAVRTPERLQIASFVGPYYSAPSAIVSRLDGGWPTIASLAGRTLAIDGEHYLIPIIQREVPGVKLHIVPTAAGVLDAVANARADAGITNIEVAAALVGTRYAGRLQVSGTVEDNPSELYFMVRADRPDLAGALRAGFDAVPENDRRVLANSLLRTSIAVGLNWRDVALVVGPVVAGLAGLLVAAAVYAGRLRRTQQQLRQERDRAQATAAERATFLAEMSHEVRTPLAALTSGLRLLTREPLSGAARTMAQPLLRSSERLVGLLNNLLDVARLEADRLDLQAQATDVALLVRELVEQFQPQARAKGVALTVHTPTGLPWLMLDAQRTQQVINNLVSNAIKFTDAGQVQVELGARELQPARWELRLRVKDSGVGMSEAVRAKLFRRFTQAPGTGQRYGGTGLGLAISHEIVKRAGGHIEVHSEPGRGSDFIVTVMATAAPQAAAAKGSGAALKHLLLVDDDPVNQIVFAEHLRGRGYLVEVAGDADQALQQLQRTPFDLLVTDVSLGAGANGLELARRARALGAAAPRWVLVLSGEDPPADLPQDIDAWLSKPRHADDRNWLEGIAHVAGEKVPEAAVGA